MNSPQKIHSHIFHDKLKFNFNSKSKLKFWIILSTANDYENYRIWRWHGFRIVTALQLSYYHVIFFLDEFNVFWHLNFQSIEKLLNFTIQNVLYRSNIWMHHESFSFFVSSKPVFFFLTWFSVCSAVLASFVNDGWRSLSCHVVKLL